MKRVLVTGASGFIGWHCLQTLMQSDYEIHCVTSNPNQTFPDWVIKHEANLFDEANARHVVSQVEASHLLHLAWYVEPGKLISAPENFDWVTSSLRLVRLFREFGGERLVVSGSCYEYDWHYGYCSDLTPTNPDTIYGECKNSLHQLIGAYANDSGLSYGWGRVFFLYGPRENRNRLVSSVICSLLSNQPAKCSHGKQIRDYMHVQDVADGLVALLDSNFYGACNVASGEATTIHQIVTKIGEQLDLGELVQLGAIPARKNDAPLVVGDSSDLCDNTNWRKKYDLESGLSDTIDWWKTNT